MMKWCICILITLCMMAQADTLIGVVTKVSDGDTITVVEKKPDGKKVVHRVRLKDIDAPEHGQEDWNKSHIFLTNLLWAETVTVEYTEKDKHGRILGDVILNGVSAGDEMVKNGWAWRWRYSTNERIKRMAEEARAAGIGLWAKPNPEDPVDWKARHQK